MNYFLIYKTDKITECASPISLSNGYKFTRKISITLYEPNMIRYILTRKLNKSLKNLINLYLECENDDEDNEDARGELEPKIELLRKILLENYSFFLKTEEVEDYLIKLEKLEKKASKWKSKKTRSL